MSDLVTWNFTTASGGDNLDVIAINPVDNATGIDIRQDIWLEFDEPVFVTNKNITISTDQTNKQADVVINALDDTQVLPKDINGDPDGNTPFGPGTMAIRINPTYDLYGSNVSVDGSGNYTVNATTAYTITIPQGTFTNAAGTPVSRRCIDGIIA